MSGWLRNIPNKFKIGKGCPEKGEWGSRASTMPVTASLRQGRPVLRNCANEKKV